MGSISGLNNDLVIQSRLFVEEYDSQADTDVLLINGSYVGYGGLYFNKSGSQSNSELSFFDNSSGLTIGYGSGVTDRILHLKDDSFFEFRPKLNGTSLKLNNLGQFSIGPSIASALVHINHNDLKLKIEALGTGDGDSRLVFGAGSIGVIGHSQYVPNSFIISDEKQMLNAGADLAIDMDGNVDIAYNIRDFEAALPSHNVKVDVKSSCQC